jgi:rare lipoprotein A
MKPRIIIFVLSLMALAILCGCGSDSNSNSSDNASYETGRAAFYALEENGTLTSNNTRYERSALTASHKNLPYGTKIKVTDLNNGRNVIVTINDHNMPEGDYVIKLSEKAANELAASNEHEFSIDIIKWG